MSSTLSNRKALLLISLLICLAPKSWADKSAREAVEALEAYAVYKMAMYEDAFSRFMALANKGNHQGMLNVAGMLAAGQGTAQDLHAAFNCYHKSASAGSAIGMFYVAEAYQHGRGVAQDSTSARQWYLKASNNGSQDAQIAHARLLLDSADTQQAVDWLKQWSGSNSGAAQLLATIDGTANTTTTDIAPLDRILITSAWESIDRSAQAGNAPGVVYFLHRDTQVRLRLPNLPTWTILSRDELRALWQRNFDLSGQYRFSRSDLQIERVDDSSKRYKILSTIDEVLPVGLLDAGIDTGPATGTDTSTATGIKTGTGGEAETTVQALTITETALIRLIEDNLQVDEISLDISTTDD